jgi:hypothetical protein|tara:strand:+ start:281 stop:481 length:201 start_codon:yes stop_codon:yes gene_type:complete
LPAPGFSGGFTGPGLRLPANAQSGPDGILINMKNDQEMKQAYRLFRRKNGVYFIEHTCTGEKPYRS